MIVTAATPDEFGWIEERTGCILTRNARAIAARDSQGIRGMVAYDAWTEAGAQAHMAVDAPIVWRSLLRPAFEYPFQQLGKNLLMGVIPAHNRKSVEMVKALGFREAHRIQGGWDAGDDLVLFELRRDECRWIQPQRRAA